MSKYVPGTGMTISQISKKSGVPYSTVQEYLSAGKDIGKCSLRTFRALADAIGTSMDGLYAMLTEKEKVKEARYKGIKLPETFRSTFWDREFENMDLDEETDFIIVRLFTHGGFKGIKYAEETFAKEDILHALKTRRDLNPVIANYVSNRYGLKRQEMAYYTAVYDTGNDWRETCTGKF